MDSIETSLIIGQSKWKTWVLAFFSLSGISVSSYYLQKDFYTFSSVNHGEELGRVTLCDSEAKRKHADSYLWSRLGQGQGVFLKDSIRVGPQGFATINLKDGTNIELGENSLVIIDDPKTLALKFVRGSFIVADARGQRVVSVQRDGRALERELFVRMLSPVPAARFISQPKKPVAIQLTWAFKEGADVKLKENARLLIGRDRLFQSSDVILVPLAGLKSEEWKANLPVGRYYWKVMGASENLSEVRDFIVLSLDPLVPLFPVKNQTVSLYSGHLNVPFRWLPEAPEKGVAVFLDVSAKENFSQNTRSLTVDTRTGLAVVEGLETGKYFWRLRSQTSGESIVSAVSEFSLSQREKLDMVLREPSDGSTFELGREIRFTWDVIEGDFDYHWESEGPLGVATDIVKGGKAMATKGSSVTWAPEVPGQYRWRVVPHFNGAKVGESLWRPLSVVAPRPIALLKPEPQEKVSFWDRNWKVTFRWESQSGADGKTYRLKIAEDLAMKKNMMVFSSSDNEFAWTPTAQDEGGYRYWQIEWLGANQEVVRVSGPRRFFFGMADVLAPPLLKSPAPDAEISLNETVKDPELTWSALDKAVGYEIKILREGKPWQEKNSKDSSLLLKKLKPGAYSWSVRAIDILKRKGDFSAAQAFVVKQGAKLKAPTKTEWEVE